MTNTSIVAMFGWIMPAPLAPTTPPPRRPIHANEACATFGPTSVVRIACEAASSPEGERRHFASGSAARIFASGRTTPMTPVDETMTSSFGNPRSAAAQLRTRRAASRPGFPVTAFAQPAFTTTARTRPRLRARSRLPRMTGAAWNRFFVNRAAAFAPFSATRSARSGRFFRMPARTPEAKKPFGSFMPHLPRDAVPRPSGRRKRRAERLGLRDASADELMRLAERHAPLRKRVGELGGEQAVVRSRLSHPLAVELKPLDDARQRRQRGEKDAPHAKDGLLVELEVFVVSERQPLENRE